MEAIHKCREDMICLLPGERKYKCYKCLDREKDFIHKDEVAQVIGPICLEIAKESYGEKHNRFVQYSKQNIFSEQEVNEILESVNTPDEERQNPLIVELRATVAKLNAEIQERDARCKEYQIEIESLKKYISEMNSKEEKNKQLEITHLTLIEFIHKQCKVNILKKYKLDNVPLWAIEWALRSNNQEMLDMLLNIFFEGVVKIELLDTSFCTDNYCSRIIFRTKGSRQQYLHVTYNNLANQYKNRIGFIVNLPVSCCYYHGLKFRSHFNNFFRCCIINHKFKTEFPMFNGANMQSGHAVPADDKKYIYSPSIGIYQKDGYMITTEKYNDTYIYCENSILKLNHQQISIQKIDI